MSTIRFLKNKKSGDGSSSPNVFCQLEEPTIKKGIWLQTDKHLEHIYQDIPFDFPINWLDISLANVPIAITAGAGGMYNGEIFLLRNSSVYKYNIQNNTYTLVKTLSGFTVGGAAYCTVGENIYILGTDTHGTYMKQIRKYNMSTNVLSSCYTFEGGQFYQMASVVNDIIYVFGGYYESHYKFNPTNNSVTNIAAFPISGLQYAVAVSAGTDIYFFGGKLKSDSSYNRNVYKYNTLTNTYTNLGQILPYDLERGSAIVLHSKIYIFGGNTTESYVYEFDPEFNTFKKINDIPYKFYGGVFIYNVNSNKVFLFGSNTGTLVQDAVVAEGNIYENNSVVIEQISAQPQYKTEMFSSELNNQKPMSYKFNDAWFYTTQDGLITNIPTYYGNGTQWIKFKN